MRKNGERKTSSGSKNYVINFLSVQKLEHLKKIKTEEDKSCGNL